MSPRLQGVLLRVAAIVALVYLLAPISMVIPVSLTDQRMLSMPVHGLSLQHYQTVLHSRDWIAAAGQSLVIGIVSTLLALTIATFSAIGCWMLGQRKSGFFRIVNLLPIVIPSIIYALGAYRFLAELGLFDTLAGVILVHTIGSIPFVFVAISTNLDYLDIRLVHAARSLGAGLLRTVRAVILPNIRPGLVSAAIFAFLHSWDEVVVTLFVTSHTVRTLPRKMWEGLNENLDPTVACVAVALIFLTVLLLMLEHRASSSRQPAVSVDAG
jgi:putative spermidine/putrescine transport system permease protein